MARAPSRPSVSREAAKAFRIEGIAEIQANIAKVMNRAVGTAAKDVYYRAGVILRDRARANAPYDPGRKKGTHLRDAIFCGRGDPTKPNVLVGVRYKVPGAPHAHLVEFGTSKWAGKPYFRPALAQSGPQIASTIKDGLLKIINDATR